MLQEGVDRKQGFLLAVRTRDLQELPLQVAQLLAVPLFALLHALLDHPKGEIHQMRGDLLDDLQLVVQVLSGLLLVQPLAEQLSRVKLLPFAVLLIPHDDLHLPRDALLLPLVVLPLPLHDNLPLPRDVHHHLPRVESLHHPLVVLHLHVARDARNIALSL